MSAVLPEAFLELEARLVAYVRSLQGGGNPLDDLLIFAGHGEADLDNTPSYGYIVAERADTQPLWQAGLERVEVRMMIQSQADDVALAVHDKRVGGFRVAFDLRNFNDRTVGGVVVPGFKTIINATPGFGLSGWSAGSPPIEDGFDKEKKRRQALFRFRATCGLELA